MCTVGEEDNHWEIVAQDEFTDASEDKKHAAEPDRWSRGRDRKTA